MVNKTAHTIINGDSRQMNELADRSVHLIVTSPHPKQDRHLAMFPGMINLQQFLDSIKW
jgi:DNA modification methylase